MKELKDLFFLTMPILNNLQNIVVNGYKRPLSRHRIFEFPAGCDARRFVACLVALVPSAEAWDGRPREVLHVAFSAEGLRRLEVLGEAALMSFKYDFLRPLKLDDLRDQGATYWAGMEPGRMHCLVSSWADTSVEDEALAAKVAGWAADCCVRELLVTPWGAQIKGALLGGNSPRVHFGYRDGITKAEIDWAVDAPADRARDYRNIVVGYGTADFPSSPNTYSSNAPTRQEAVVFARDGSYLAFTLIKQEVAAFNAYLEEQAQRLLGPGAGAEAVAAKVEWLAAKFMGRWRDGQPLARVPEGELNAFDFSDDQKGLCCPMTAHIRITNPRSQPLGPLKGPVPVIARRGMPYGPEMTGGEGQVEAGTPRGLIGLFMCADLTEQFVKLVKWMNQSDFSPAFLPRVRDEDPLMGNGKIEQATREFEIPTEQGPLTLKGLPNFTRTLGTAFFFLPSMSALQRIATPPPPVVAPLLPPG
jgi:deferrochelatase/peroxidase EfeB